MTDRYHSFTVMLEHDIREDDAEDTIKAIRQLRGVLHVTGNVASPEASVQRMRARREIQDAILKVLRDFPSY